MTTGRGAFKGGTLRNFGLEFEAGSRRIGGGGVESSLNLSEFASLKITDFGR
jgi:hypothetical protein